MPIAPSSDYTFGPMETDKETGLPFLPDDLVWRVSRAQNRFVKVSLAHMIDGEVFDFASDKYAYAEPTSEDLKAAAQSIYSAVREEQQKYGERESLIGLYPPNSL